MVLLALVVFLIGFGASAPFLGGSNLAVFSSTFGRDETLTGRTETWAELVPVVKQSAAARVRIREFLDDRPARVLRDEPRPQRLPGHPAGAGRGGTCSVHGLAAVLRPETPRRSSRRTTTGAAWRSCFLLMAVVYNATESALNSLAEHMTAVVALASLVVPYEPIRAFRRSHLRLRLHVPPQRDAGTAAAQSGPPENRGPVRATRSWWWTTTPAGTRARPWPEFRRERGLDVTYSIEPEHTIPAARNHALRLARGNYIGIIDDDEFPPPDWLLRMYEGIRTFAVDGALGPVYPFFAGAPPAWLVKSGICELPVYRTGTLLHWSQTRTGQRARQEGRVRRGTAWHSTSSSAPAARIRSSSGRPWHEDAGSSRWKKRLSTRSFRRCAGHGKYWVKRALVNGFNARRYASAGMSRARQAYLTIKSAAAAAVYALALPVCACLGPHRLIALPGEGLLPPQPGLRELRHRVVEAAGLLRWLRDLWR